MTCEQLTSLADDLALGRLEPELEERLRQHAAGCPACTAELRSSANLAAHVRRLPVERQPETDLWRQIRPALLVRPRRSAPSWMMLAAASLIAFSLGLALRFAPARQGAPLATMAASTSAPAAEWASLAYREDRFEHVRQDLQAAIEERRGELAPETLALIEDNLRTIDTAIGNLRRALADSPDDPRLPIQIANIYRQQTRVARQLERTIRSS